MNMWDNHSRVIHAVADHPAGPYARVGVAIPAYAHCVDHVRVRAPRVRGEKNTDVWLLFHNGDGAPRQCGEGTPDCEKEPLKWLAQCPSHNGTTPDPSQVYGRPAPAPPSGFEVYNGIHVSASGGPEGPWVAPPAAAGTCRAMRMGMGVESVGACVCVCALR